MGTPWLWIGFNAVVLAALAFDLGVFHRQSRIISISEAAVWSVLWVSVSLAFGFAIFFFHGSAASLEFFTGYLIEKALSLDNLLVILLIFRTFAVSEQYQPRVLSWGIVGALIMRGAMIALGATLVNRFSWILYLFGAFLVFAGGHMLFSRQTEIHPERSRLFLWVRKIIPSTQGYEDGKLLTHRAGRWLTTPLFLVLVVIELSDVAFAVDSIPAVFGLTRDPFIVYTSNVLAILGLRALYFLLAGVLPRLKYLSDGLAVVLIFVGAKMLVEPRVSIPTHVSLGIVAGIFIVTIVASLVSQRGESNIPSSVRTKVNDGREISRLVAGLASADGQARQEAAAQLYRRGTELGRAAIEPWLRDADMAQLLLHTNANPLASSPLCATAGIAVEPVNFDRIPARNGSPHLAHVPPDQDALEFELTFEGGIHLDILTTKAGGDRGVIARYLEKFGEGIQQIEYLTLDVDRATELLRERFAQESVYPATRAGADGTRVNFFLVNAADGKTTLIELVEPPAPG